MQGVVLAAGAGKRLRPATLSRSKATVPVCGSTLIGQVLETFAAAGIDDYLVVVQQRGDDVEDSCRRWAGGRSLTFVEQPERLGMGDALRRAAPHLTGHFIVSACDSFVEPEFLCRLVEHHRQHGGHGTLALERATSPEQIARMAMVTLEGDQIVAIVEKPDPAQAPSDLASMPLYLFSPKLLDHLADLRPSPRGEVELQDAITGLIESDGGCFGLLAPRRWQVTTTDDLLAINRARLESGEVFADGASLVEMPVYIQPGAVLGAGCRIGPYAVLEAGAVMGDRATVRDAVVLRDAVVEAGETVAGRVVCPVGEPG